MPVVKKITAIVYSLYILCATAHAKPWIPSDDIWIRQDIELLNGLGIFSTPITTWPLIWSNVANALNAAPIDQIPTPYHEVYLRLKQAAQNNQKAGISFSHHISMGNEAPLFQSFGDSIREDTEIHLTTSYYSDLFFSNANLSWTNDPSDNHHYRGDGSYLGLSLGNWALSAGYIDQWWGPTWHSALIISNNARPRPSLYFRRISTKPFKNPWLSWIGHWDIVTFASLLDDDRFIKDAKLLGMRVSFKPLKTLEIGLNRTAQWGGEKRPENIESLINLLFGRDNCGSDGIDDCSSRISSNEPGNQIAGVDVRWTVTPQVDVYAETIGEDEAGGFPSKKSWSTGINFHFNMLGKLNTFNVEYSNTIADGNLYHVTYEHNIYRTGYQYRGRTIGHSIGRDSEAIITSLISRITPALSLQLIPAYYEYAGGNPYMERDSIARMTAKMRYDTKNWGQWSLTAGYTDIKPTELEKESRIQAQLSWKYHY